MYAKVWMPCARKLEWSQTKGRFIFICFIFLRTLSKSFVPYVSGPPFVLRLRSFFSSFFFTCLKVWQSRLIIPAKNVCAGVFHYAERTKSEKSRCDMRIRQVSERAVFGSSVPPHSNCLWGTEKSWPGNASSGLAAQYAMVSRLSVLNYSRSSRIIVFYYLNIEAYATSLTFRLIRSSCAF